ncbi:MAG: hypothetical protein JW993_13530 [Sedimentisphaerales bacterium]|nr:hypothetical protein [Sedimentisphaerales bacterium]
MSTVFSHIIQKRFSQVNEDVATDALAYVLESSEAARNGMTKLLRGISPDLPSLRFKVQQIEGTIRPDMWGFADAEPRVFVENKFWAGLTDNQPVSYLKQLAAYPKSTVLLVVAPAAREHTLWRELSRRLLDAGISVSVRAAPAGVAYAVETQLGPILALTSWTNILSVLEHEAVDDPGARGDLVQLRALCDSVDADAFPPVTHGEMSDQRTPAFVLQLSSIVQSAVDLAVTEKAIFIGNLRPQASWDRIGRYARLSSEPTGGAGAWFGVHFDLWKIHGTTPLWLVFSDGDFGRGQEVGPLIESWATQEGILTVSRGHDIAVALEIPVGEEKDGVIRSLVDDLKAVTTLLEALPSQASQIAARRGDDEPTP